MVARGRTPVTKMLFRNPWGRRARPIFIAGFHIRMRYPHSAKHGNQLSQLGRHMCAHVRVAGSVCAQNSKCRHRVRQPKVLGTAVRRPHEGSEFAPRVSAFGVVIPRFEFGFQMLVVILNFKVEFITRIPKLVSGFRCPGFRAVAPRFGTGLRNTTSEPKIRNRTWRNPNVA